MSDLPPIQLCIDEAAYHYSIPAPLIQSILDIEAGGLGVVANNRNGTQDLGWAQINTVWLPELAEFDITRDDLLTDPCTNISVGAWILRKRYAKYQNWPDAIASYNAGFRLEYGREYAAKVIDRWHINQKTYKVTNKSISFNMQ